MTVNLAPQHAAPTARTAPPPEPVRGALLDCLLEVLGGASREQVLHALFLGLARGLPDTRVCLSLENGRRWESLADTWVRCTEGSACRLRVPSPDPDAAAGRCGDCANGSHARVACAIGGAALAFDVPCTAVASGLSDLDAVATVVRRALRGFGGADEPFPEAARREAGETEALTRELHDSVAQQLGFMSLLVSRLQMKRQQPEPLLAELRTMMTRLQRQVRELITSARLTLDGRTLQQALADSVAEFSRRCDVAFELDNRVPDLRLEPSVELHVLQIVREALSNVVRHAQARHAWIELRAGARGGVQVSVTDDGIGLGPASADDNHHGLNILRERARAIGAAITIGNGAWRGTRVSLLVPDHIIQKETR